VIGNDWVSTLMLVWLFASVVARHCPPTWRNLTALMRSPLSGNNG
jgi:hypothetical protein